MEYLQKLKSKYIYILVDTILVGDFLVDWLNCNKVEVFNLFKGTLNSHIDFYSSPLLLNVSSLNIYKIDNLIQNIKKIAPALVLLNTNYETNEIVKLFKEMMFPLQDQELVFFRFYDPVFFSKINLIFEDINISNYFSDIYCLLEDMNSYQKENILKRVV